MKYIGRKTLALVFALATALSVFLTSGRSETVLCLAEADIPEYVSVSGGDFKVSSRFWELFVGKNKNDEKTVLIPGGMVFGARVKQTCVTVQDVGGHTDVKSGDKLLKINGKRIESARDVKDILSLADGTPLTLTLERGGESFDVKLVPREEDGEYKLGLGLKDGAAGIGTITYIDPETGAFGGLGHGICDSESGEVIEISSGAVTGVILGGTKKGEAGKPGELSGILTDKCIGTVYANTPCGVFGVIDKLPDSNSCVSIPVGKRSEVHTGSAVIYSTVKNGKTRQFDIEITEVDTDSHGTKSFKIKVTDPALIAITGGIVRGMSGSPIIQDGKLIGAVTHVMVADPTEGYGIFIENMLSAAEQQVQPKAA
ncbi:MAG: SpoIVB peptidase [Clostridia bacterium]|nr:SpoIVB peptidase [Clostridia bacterium]